MTPVHDDKRRAVRVGAFLATALVLLAIAIFVLGRTQSLFGRKVLLHTAFDDASGLMVGSPVELAGVEVGVVRAIHFDRDPRIKKVHVTLSVDARYLDRIREDSLARLSSKGLLGDTLVNLSVGSADAPRLRDGSFVRGQESAGLTQVVDSVTEAIAGVRKLTGAVDQRLGAVFTDELGRDLQRAAHATADVAEHIERGDGLAHAVVYDPALTRDARRTLDGAARAAVRLDGAAARMSTLVDDVQHGGGTLHALIYRDDTRAIIGDLERAAADLADATHQLRDGKGLAHNLVYQEDHSRLDENLTRLSAILRQLGEEVAQGKGTVGALLKDPSVYEDLKTLLGNLQRNTLLRWLVRYTITHDGLRARPGGGAR